MTAKRESLVVMNGSSSHATWSYAPETQTNRAELLPPAEKPVSGDAGRKFECDVCGKRFILRTSLAEHKRMRHGVTA
jgi:hypothetical protein